MEDTNKVNLLGIPGFGLVGYFFFQPNDVFTILKILLGINIFLFCLSDLSSSFWLTICDIFVTC